MSAYCDQVLELVDAVASGDEALTPQLAAHIEGCGGCARALERARRIERLLQARPVVPPPAQFTQRTVARVRRDRWQREQLFDRVFNAMLGVAVLAIAGVVLLLVSNTGVSDVAGDIIDTVGSQSVAFARAAAPSLPMYAAAAALIATALGLWWWAEN